MIVPLKLVSKIVPTLERLILEIIWKRVFCNLPLLVYICSIDVLIFCHWLLLSLISLLAK